MDALRAFESHPLATKLLHGLQIIWLVIVALQSLKFWSRHRKIEQPSQFETFTFWWWYLIYALSLFWNIDPYQGYGIYKTKETQIFLSLFVIFGVSLSLLYTDTWSAVAFRISRTPRSPVLRYLTVLGVILTIISGIFYFYSAVTNYSSVKQAEKIALGMTGFAALYELLLRGVLVFSPEIAKDTASAKVGKIIHDGITHVKSSAVTLILLNTLPAIALILFIVLTSNNTFPILKSASVHCLILLWLSVMLRINWIPRDTDSLIAGFLRNAEKRVDLKRLQTRKQVFPAKQTKKQK